MAMSTDDLRRGLRQQLESLAAAGVGQLPRAGASPPKHQSEQPRLTPERPAEVEPVGKAVAQAALATADVPSGMFQMDAPPTLPISAAPTLEVLQQEVAGCTLCGELAATRTQTVFGVGNRQARLCFMGEAPGADEDRLGEPFVGRAGQLLNKILEACRLSRNEVYILNTIKCRPPGNRNPLPDEAANCRRYLDRQLQLIAPDYICCLGAVAAQNLLATTAPIGRLRGRMHDYRGIKVVCTYHPAYLLRNPAAKADVWTDMKFLMREMGTPLD